MELLFPAAGSLIFLAAVSPAGQPQQVRMVVNGFVAAKSKHVCPSEE